jgi:TolB-like protein
VLTSSAFAPSRRSREFLSYVVTEQLAGRGDRLSERTVGRRALGLDGTFDGRRDSSVRVRATRVRAALTAYYTGGGALDPVRIELPPGTYAPVFRWGAQDDDEHGSHDLNPGLAVVHFTATGHERAGLVGTAVAEALVQRLLSFGDLQVVGPITTRLDDARDIARAFGVRFVLQGSVRVDAGMVRLAVRLVDGATATTVWTTTSTNVEGPPFDLEDQWATELAAALGDSTGVLHRYELTTPQTGHVSSSQAAMRAYYKCQEDETPESVNDALLALDAAIADGDRTPMILALRAWVGAVAVAYELSPDTELEHCRVLAQEAAAAVPSTALAQVALGMVAFVQKEYDLAGEYGRQAAGRAPHHPSVLMAAATLTCLTGDWEHGEGYAREAFRLNPDHPGQFNVLPAIARLLDDDPAQALAEATLVHTPGQVWGPLYRAMALAGLGHHEQAAREMRQVLEIDPTFLDEPLAYFREGMRVTPEHAETLQRYFDAILAFRIMSAAE